MRGRLPRAVVVCAVLAALVGTAWLLRLLPARDAIDRLDRHALATAVSGGTRRVEARVSGVRFQAFDGAHRGATRRTPDAVPVEALATVSEMISRARHQPTAESLADLGAALLLIGRGLDAIEALEESTRLNPAAASVWSDLGAAYLERHLADGRVIDLPRGLEAVERSLALSASHEARFNRALLLDRLNLMRLGAAAWQAYIDHEEDPAWRDEARSRLASAAERQQTIQQSAEAQHVRERLVDDTLLQWANAPNVAAARQALEAARGGSERLATWSKDQLAHDIVRTVSDAATKPSPASTVLALQTAHRAYGEGRAAYKRDAYAEAEHSMIVAEAEGVRGRSAIVVLTRLYRALLKYRVNDLPAATAISEGLLTDEASARYPSIRGRAHWTLGLMAALRSDSRLAIVHYTQARRLFDEASEPANRAFVEMLHASQLDLIGDAEGAWRLRLSALPFVDRESPVQAAAQAASTSGWPRVAAVLFDLVADMARQGGRETVLVDALRSRARALMRAGDAERAREYLSEARQIANRHPERGWDMLRAEIDLAESETAQSREPATAVSAATRAFDFFARNGRDVRVPEVLLLRARAHLNAADVRAAERDLLDGITAVERLRSRLDEWRLRAILGDVVQRYGDDLVRLRAREGRTDEAFEVAERLRGWELRDRADAPLRSMTLPEIARRVPGSALLAWFDVQDEETAVWVIGAGRSRFVKVPVTRGQLAHLVATQFTLQQSREQLRNYLLAPMDSDLEGISRLVVVPDGPLHLLSFAALPGRRTRFLVEEMAVQFVPNASVLATNQGASATVARALVIGNPDFDRSAFGELRTLPEALDEAAGVAALYQGARVLTAGQATRTAVLDGLPNHDVFHFAGHSLVNDFAPGESRLVVAGTGGAGISAIDVSRLSLRQLQLVVLSSCESLAGVPNSSEGPLGLARAFLSAGARTVVASQRPVADRPARVLTTAFHKQYQRTRDAADALRAAQLSLIQSQDPALVSPEQWGAFLVIGAS